MDDHFSIKLYNSTFCYKIGTIPSNEIYHNLNGPAISHNNGVLEWFVNGIRHREDGPAIYLAGGSQIWYKNGKKHREDGPAAIFVSLGFSEWYYNNLLHREDGPAIEWQDGKKKWYFQGEEIHCKNNEEFKRIIKLRAFI